MKLGPVIIIGIFCGGLTLLLYWKHKSAEKNQSAKEFPGKLRKLLPLSALVAGVCFSGTIVTAIGGFSRFTPDDKWLMVALTVLLLIGFGLEMAEHGFHLERTPITAFILGALLLSSLSVAGQFLHSATTRPVTTVSHVSKPGG
jgi:hypothetical protein